MLSINIFALLFILWTPWTSSSRLSIPSGLSPSLNPIPGTNKEILRFDLMVLVDHVALGNENQEIQYTTDFIHDVNRFLATTGQFKDAIVQLNLIQVNTIPDFFDTTDPGLFYTNERLSEIYKTKYGQPGHFAMLLTKWTGSTRGGYAKYQLCKDEAPTGIVTDFTWHRRIERVNTFAHELGHLLGLLHDEELECPDIGLVSSNVHYSQPKEYSSCSNSDFSLNLPSLRKCM